MAEKYPTPLQRNRRLSAPCSSTPGVYRRCLEKLKADEFYIKLNRDIYETIYTMFSYGQTIDPVTVLDQMRSPGRVPGRQ